MRIDLELVLRFCRILGNAKNVVIVGHLNPDGDCIGSITGMKGFLEKFLSGETSISMIVPSALPYYLEFMYSAPDIVVYSQSRHRAASLIKEADVIICMDFNNLYRTEGMEDLIRNSTSRKILIDHHPSPEGFAELTISETNVSSASELTWWLISEVCSQTGAEIPVNVMESLYTGMMTDTNNFNNSVFPSTFLMASKIADAGIDRERIQMEVMNCFSKERMRLMGYMLYENGVMFPHLVAVCMVLDDPAKGRVCYRDGDSEGFVNLALKIKDVEISALFTQGDEFIKVSLRSKGAVSVNRLSRRFFNGGGHERAAGGRLYMPIEEVRDYFEKALQALLEESRHSF